jgi:hypothetical protein
MSSGLAPHIAGQDGPTLEQLLTRNLKNWKPFSSDADFKEALNDWLDHIMRQLALGGSDHASLRATVSYINTTLGYLNSYGHRLVYKYHKAVMLAMRKVPPLYDPLVNGPTYTQAYVETFHSATASRLTTMSQRNYKQSGNRRDPVKRNRSEQPCEAHPGSNHTNGECRSQQASKRPAQGRRTGTTPTSDS